MADEFDTNQIPLIDCDIHPYATKEFPIEPHIPEEFREAMRQGMGSERGAMGISNPFGVNRRDVKCENPIDVARDHLDRYGVAYGVLQPPGMRVSLTTASTAGRPRRGPGTTGR